MEEITARLLTATRQWLKPLVCVLLRSGITWKEFAELTRSVYVEVAMKRFGRRSRPANVSRMAVLTGLARRDVRRIRDELSSGPGAPTGYTSKGSMILSHWHQEPQFCKADGTPRQLTVDGPGASFEELIRHVRASDVKPATLLKELIAAGAVRVLPSGKLEALARSCVPQALSAESVRMWGSVIADLAITRSHNLLRDETTLARFERAAVNDRIDPRALPAFRELLAKEGQAFLERIDAWLTEHEMTDAPTARRTPIRLGAGVYHIETPPEPPRTTEDSTIH
jgi:hypothetical protein